jgi:hypothetical protein
MSRAPVSMKPEGGTRFQTQFHKEVLGAHDIRWNMSFALTMMSAGVVFMLPLVTGSRPARVL